MHKQGKDSVPFVQVSAKSNLKKEPSRYKETNACIGEWGRAIRFSCIIFQLLKTPNVFTNHLYATTWLILLQLYLSLKRVILKWFYRLSSGIPYMDKVKYWQIFFHDSTASYLFQDQRNLIFTYELVHLFFPIDFNLRLPSLNAKTTSSKKVKAFQNFPANLNSGIKKQQKTSLSKWYF